MTERGGFYDHPCENQGYTCRKPSNKKKIVAPPSQAEIAKLAEEYWLQRGKTDGMDEHDWLRAEQELRGKAS